MTAYQELSDWVGEQYRSGLRLRLPSALAELSSEFPAKFPDPENQAITGAFLAGLLRIWRFVSLKTRFPLSASGYRSVVLTASIEGTRVNYAYLYWRRGGPELSEPEYICLGSTYSSRDGEYRGRFVPYDGFARAVEQIGQALDPYERAVLRSVEAGASALTLTSAEYPPAAGELTTWVTDHRTAITALAVLLGVDAFVLGMLADGHVSGAYVDLLAKLVEANPELISTPAPAATDPAWNRFATGTTSRSDPQCGQKLVPMYVSEVIEPGWEGLPAWRELAVSQAASDLVINYVAPNFACYGQWTYVEGAGANLFENADMVEKYVRNEAALDAIRELRAARGRLEAGPDNRAVSGIRRELEALADQAQRALILAPVALMHTLEDVGQPLWGLGHYVRHAPAENEMSRVFGSRVAAASRLFEFVYGAHCLHSRLGVCHADLHGNNLTLFRWGRRADPGDRLPRTLYVTGPEPSDCFLTLADGMSGALIDYSRSLLGPEFRGRLTSGPSTSRADAVYSEQRPRAIRTLRRYAPNSVPDSVAAALATATEETVFALLTAVDYIAIGASVAAVAEEAQSHETQPGELRAFAVAPECAPMARRVEALGRDFLTSGLRAIAEGKPPRLEPTLWTRVGNEVFAEWRWPAVAEDAEALARIAIADAYNFTNPLAYSGSDYARFPPWARLDEIQKRLHQTPITNIIPRGAEPLLESTRPRIRPEAVAEETLASMGSTATEAAGSA